MIFHWFKKIIPNRVFLCFQPAYHFIMSFAAALWYGFPSRKLVVIGVTGTKGKTTVVELIHGVLEQSGHGVASMSSLSFRMKDKRILNSTKMTMPGRFFIQKFLYDALHQGSKYAVLEVTSEGIKQFRHRFIKFRVAAMTNISPEHIESHDGFENYLRAKLDLFWRLDREAIAVINKDDPSAPRFVASSAAYKIFYSEAGIRFGARHIKIGDIKIDKDGVGFDIDSERVSSSLCGKFNFYNILTAISVGLSQHVLLEKIVEAISGVFMIPGRLEFIQKEPFAAVVDYAHTPDSLKKVYTFFKESNPKSEPGASLLRSSPAKRNGGLVVGDEISPLTAPGISSSTFVKDVLGPSNKQDSKLICVLGASGGGRDKWKRPEMGKIAAEFCDEIILTNEDPYDEDPQLIINDVESGIPKSHKLKTKSFLDRRKAIHEALGSAKAGDIVIITGKGSEPWMMGVGGTKIPWDDREVVRGALN